MTYSEKFPKQKIMRREKIGNALKSNRHRNTTGKKYFLPSNPKKVR